MDRTGLVGAERAGVLERPGRGEVEPLDEDEDDVVAQDRRRGRASPTFGSSSRLLLVAVVEAEQDEEEEGEDDDDQPRALGELGHGEDERRSQGEHGGEPVDPDLQRQPGRRSRRWCLTIPAPAIVKPVKTPIA